jgi:hypothetical protein
MEEPQVIVYRSRHEHRVEAEEEQLDATGERSLSLLRGNGEASEPESFAGDLLPCAGEGFLDLRVTGSIHETHVDGEVEGGEKRTAEIVDGRMSSRFSMACGCSIRTLRRVSVLARPA